jgi:hypothetical protein
LPLLLLLLLLLPLRVAWDGPGSSPLSSSR